MTEYSFNPLQAEKELQTGNYYFKKGSYRAAASRFREATRWNDGFIEAWLRLGEAEEKLKDRQAAKEAYAKYLALAADAPTVSGDSQEVTENAIKLTGPAGGQYAVELCCPCARLSRGDPGAQRTFPSALVS